jgi:hypothetical protein
MAKISYLAAQVPSAPTYNWSVLNSLLGDLDIGLVSTDAPGVGSGTGLNNITTSIPPRPVFQPALGQVVAAVEPTLGGGEFIYLAVPTSAAIPLGTAVTWNNTFQAVAVPAKGTSQKTGIPVAVCVASTVANSGNGITSNASSAQYAWFQVTGAVQTLKTAVQVTPVTAAVGAGIYVSTTAGRVYVTASTGGQVLGARLGNAATVTSTASCVLVILNRSAVEGF